jgi:hypothetical protein
MSISFKSFLLETQFDTSELIEKTARSGEYDSKWRTYILKKLINKHEPLELKDGTKIVIDTENALVKHLLALIPDKNEKLIGDKANELKDFLKKEKPFVDKSGTAYKLSDIKKSEAFGGGTKGSGGGAADTEKNESLQCVALALRQNKNKKIDIDDFNEDDIKESDKYFDISFTYSNPQELADELVSNETWSKVYVNTANKLFSYLKLDETLNFYRGNSWVKSLYDLAKKLDKNDNSTFSNFNKWNPADIWLVKDSIKVPHDMTSLLELNQWLIDKFKDRTVIGVSLKKTEDASVKEINLDNAIEDIAKIDGIKFMIESRNDIFRAKDAYIVFDEDKLQLRTDQKDKPVNIQGEIKGTKAAHGKIGFGNIQKILKNLNLSQLESAAELKSLIDNSTLDKKKRYIKLIPKMTQYVKSISNHYSIDYIEEQFLASKNTESDGWVISKLQAVQLISILKKESEQTQIDFVLNAITIAASKSDLSSVYAKVS